MDPPKDDEIEVRVKVLASGEAFGADLLNESPAFLQRAKERVNTELPPSHRKDNLLDCRLWEQCLELLRKHDVIFVSKFALLAQGGPGVALGVLPGMRGISGPESLAIVNDVARLDGGPGGGHGEGAEDKQVKQHADGGSHTIFHRRVDIHRVLAHWAGTHVRVIHTAAVAVRSRVARAIQSERVQECRHLFCCIPAPGRVASGSHDSPCTDLSSDGPRNALGAAHPPPEVSALREEFRQGGCRGPLV